MKTSFLTLVFVIVIQNIVFANNDLPTSGPGLFFFLLFFGLVTFGMISLKNYFNSKKK